MGVRSPSHFAEAKVQPFSQYHIQHADPVFAWNARTQMGEGLGKTNLVIHFEQEVGDPDLRQAALKIEHHGIGLFGDSGCQTIYFEGTVFDGTTRNRTGPGSAGQSLQAIGQAGFPICQPDFRLIRHGQSWRGASDFGRDQRIFEITIPAGVCKPHITSSECITQMAQDRHLPKPMPIIVVQVPMPF